LTFDECQGKKVSARKIFCIKMKNLKKVRKKRVETKPRKPYRKRMPEYNPLTISGEIVNMIVVNREASVSEIAEAAELNVPTISKYIHATSHMNVEVMRKLLAHYEIKPDELFNALKLPL
jgi:transcriptional regulator with XRE-family HTH domain